MRWLPTSNPDRRDRRIADGLHRGDERALVALHDVHGRVVFGYLVQALGDRARAEDVFQQVMTEVWRRAAIYDPERGSLLTWVMTITRSRAVDELRRRVPEPHDPAALPDAADPTEATADVLVDRWTVAGLLDRLPDEEAMLLRLRFHEDLSQTEIADRTGLALGTVKTRMVRGLGRLRDMVAEVEGAPEPSTVVTPVLSPTAVRGGVTA